MFTMNKHAMYCTDILYPVAVYDETMVFETVKENGNPRCHVFLFFGGFFGLLKLFIKSNLAPI